MLKQKNTTDCIRLCKSNCFISKKLFEEQSIDYSKDSIDTVLQYLETKCSSPMEKIELKCKTTTELYKYYCEFKSLEKKKSDTLTLNHFISLIEWMDSNHHAIKDISIYKLKQISLHRYIRFDGQPVSNQIENCEDCTRN